MRMITAEDVRDRLAYIIDPELGVDIVNLGLVYDVRVSAEGRVEIAMTLTTRNCPLSESMPEAVRRAIAGMAGVSAVQVDLVWSPPWQPELMSPLARARLGGRR